MPYALEEATGVKKNTNYKTTAAAAITTLSQ
jgi:hypothetical protein